MAHVRSVRAPELAARLHETPHRAVYAFAGAGAQALAWLHAVGGSSRTVLEATDHYHPASLAEALGGAPRRSASTAVAAGLARRARSRAAALTARDPDPGPSFGLGLAATIATDRAKRGSHRIHVASADPLGLGWQEVVLAKGARDRGEEETLASLLVLHAAAAASGVMGVPDLAAVEGDRWRSGFEPAPELAAFRDDADAVLALDRDGRPAGDREARPAAIVSGSFRPLHAGHLRLAEAAEAHLGREVVFELPLVNADKAPIDAAEARRRAAQFFGTGPLLLTHAPLFAQKAERLPGTVFVVGADTARRVLDPRFYGGEAGLREALARIRDAGSRFLVAGRVADGAFRTVRDLEAPAEFAPLFEPLPAFRVDLSSTELRAAWP